MEMKLRYFGQLQEATGKKEEVLTEAFETLGNLRNFLVKRYPELNHVNFKIAQDNKIDSDSSPLSGNLIDLLPPFSGG
ncbi:MAG: MoaD/ThiS family protein [Flavobacteriaceae bacterium]|mgnify:FL=1|nr:MoaD/ThiS family protein [Flavobacteriaceae bacterium]|tara:strand:+ start:170 stop:403 length:234 start_codon:yes stop_codon:yes gene_type:complete